ncbi:MAG: hypothetical protein ABSF49_12990 [Roseiarcus sp.]|jgi:hypothetical protein|uniref:hypothetical protein n=1 Tax=Roseiarcus sp. TaxID=1969460 RepID=UPI003C22150A
MAGAVAGILAISGAAAFAKTAKECDTEYAANKAAIKASGQTKKDYVAACRAGTVAAPAAAPAATPAAAPATPAVAPAAPPSAAAAVPAPRATSKPAAVAPSANVGATGAGGFTSDAQARAKCPSDTVVWVNTKSGVYHFAGAHNYGATKQGTYMCEADAKAAGDRAAENEKHP